MIFVLMVLVVKIVIIVITSEVWDDISSFTRLREHFRTQTLPAAFSGAQRVVTPHLPKVPPKLVKEGIMSGMVL